MGLYVYVFMSIIDHGLIFIFILCYLQIVMQIVYIARIGYRYENLLIFQLF